MTLHQWHPAIDSQRALAIQAFDALIELTLQQSADPEVSCSPGFSARQLVEKLHSSGMADVTSTADSLAMVLLGIRATAVSGTAVTLLRDWQFLARDAIIARGVRL